MNGRRLRVIVCGTTFGQFYLSALAALPEEFEVIGVLAKGSGRSVACAERYGVPLFTDPADLPDRTDLACVVLRSGVMGGVGTELALRLIRSGVNVLQEQPVHHDDLVACLREARRRGVHFRVGDLYARLPAVRGFTAAARALLARQSAVHVDAACSVQVAFPLLHILGDALGAVRPWRVDVADGADGPFSVLTGQIGGVPLTLRVHNQVDPADPDNHLPLLHQATIGTAGGRLTLGDTHGPVTWSPRLHIPDAAKNHFDFTGPGTDHLGEPSTTVLGPSQQPGYRQVLGELWPAAIGGDLLALRAAILGEPGGERPDQYHLTLCRMWQDVTSQLGYPALRPQQVHQPVSVGDLAAAVAAVGAGRGPTGRQRTPATLHGVVAQAVTSAEAQVCGVTADHVEAFVKRLDEAVLSSVLLTLQTQGLDESGRGMPEILTAGSVAPAHHWLIERWLRELVEHGLVEREGDVFRSTSMVDEAATSRAWDLAAESWTGRLGPPEFIDYLRRNAQRLPQLMTGEQQAALLLFPEGRSALADSVYRDTVTARYLNTAVAATVRAVAAGHPGPGPLRIVEVGAGTGATTEAVTAALAEGGVRADYLFTDVSKFFLAPARERFARHPWIHFDLFDIDRDPRAQGYASGSADVVIAAGVLNNARDTGTTVRGLVELLVPGGWLLITEPAREHLEILISQAFMMTAPQDTRLDSGTTFLARRQWLDVLGDAGIDNVLTLPGEDHPLAPLGQRLFAARTAPC
ncbi:bifunctional Gfo/Idh/MocA family oxidoreductase/class I SAM-dependent methyltransferase [Streptomyces sp. RPT161]|uniref:bifunctional Gfo/Idh/MocA family oxidoreductase/class I SAM-dependent methyltransferase n=1 Tax=Streptomyces sp. RPT161 TaxID=3015993 RepID=UPI0022B895CE|nr:bifunctional Gfo/Idh/MocA family oxidoreductase/class I SAM-dependent methyltransferase [Streptomyces sp. RPT161]